MSVLQITKLCTLNCVYCFDKVHQQSIKLQKESGFMKDDDFYKYLSRMNEFFKTRKDKKSICISGGEPTLHPSFKKFVRSAINDSFKIYLLSNFTFDEKIKNFLKPIFEDGHMACLTNINSPYQKKYSAMTDQLWQNTLQNLQDLQNPNIRLSFNIFDPDVDYSYIYEIVEKYPNLDNVVRIGIENSILPDLRTKQTFAFDNDGLWPKYKKLGSIIDDIVQNLHKMGKQIYLDCGAGWCIFEPNTIKDIENKGGIIHGCNIPNDEIQPNGKYTNCYTLYNHGNEDGKYDIQNYSIKQLRRINILKTEFFKNHYLILPKCINCPMLKQGCPRFCVSNNIFYWESIYKHGNQDLQDIHYQNLTQQQKNYSQIEWYISNFDFDKAKSLLEDKKYDTYRYQLYWVIVEFFLTEDKKHSLDYFNALMEGIVSRGEKLSDKDFALAKLAELLIKNYKK